MVLPPDSHKEKRNYQRAQVIKAFFFYVIQQEQQGVVWPSAKLAQELLPRWIGNLLHEYESKLSASQTVTAPLSSSIAQQTGVTGIFGWPKYHRKEEMLMSEVLVKALPRLGAWHQSEKSFSQKHVKTYCRHTIMYPVKISSWSLLIAPQLNP